MSPPALTSAVVGALGCGSSLEEAWQGYVAHYVQADGRVIDWRGAQVSTSEAQAYAMARAMWMGDEPRFRKLQRWTIDNLQRGAAGALPGWLWGKRREGEWTLLDPEPAADADQWLAWALIGAEERWHRPSDLTTARELLGKIWERETMETPRGRLLLPGPWARDQVPLPLNPSYWTFSFWRDFARVDPAHDWLSLLGPATAVLEEASRPSGLAPDWTWMDPGSGLLTPPPPGQEQKADFGFDGFRVGWNLAAELRWHDVPEVAGLVPPYLRLLETWQREGKLPGIIHRDGTAGVTWEYPGMYGALLPLWGIGKGQEAAAMEQQELCSRLSAHGWGDRDDYYGQNWIWFGYALAGRPDPVGP